MDVENSDVDLWLLRPPADCPRDLLDHCRSLLSKEELERCAKYRSSSKQTEFLVSHAFVRRVLSEYASVDPVDWQFTTGPLGKPLIAFPSEFTFLQMNYSHTQGMIACAVCKYGEVGVDVEDASRPIDLAIADRYFSKLECEQLFELPAEHCLRRFFELWTLKEAYLKARGAGLHLPLDGFSFRFQDGNPVSLEFDSRIDDHPQRWQFVRFLTDSEHALACVVESSPTTHRHFTWHEFPADQL